MNESYVKRVVSMCSAAAMLACMAPQLCTGAITASADSSHIYINEICTGNNGENGNLTDAVDKKGEYCDWIELYNGGTDDVNIGGWQLIKDDSSVYEFGDVTLPAGGYTIVYCCKTYNGDMSLPYAPYNLSGDGVKLTLNDGTGEIDSVECPALDKDTVWARQPDGSDTFSLLFPSPAGSNNDAKSAVPCNAPMFDHESGMYSDSFNLVVTTDPGNTVYYTTDGTDPATSDTRKEFGAPLNIYNRSSERSTMAKYVSVDKITPWNNGASLPSDSAVDKGTVIRACTYSAAGEYSETVTKTYFVGVSNATHNNLPIISMTTDPKNLFDYETGIFVKGKVYDDYFKNGGTNRDNPEANYNQRGKEWERACHIDFFESDGTLALSQDCGFRTKGAYSRADYQKSLKFYARADYGEKNFKCEFFPGATIADGSGKSLNKFKKITLRNGGNDTFYAKFKDSYIQALVKDRSFDTQTGRPCVLFIDGEYWGLYTLQEEYDDSYFEENYGVNKDEVVVYKKGEIDEGTEEDIELFRSLRKFAQNNDLSKSANYEKISQMLDIDSFIDYMAAEIYIINEDWPGNNYSLWRTRTIDESNPYSDGRWRCLMYDTEMGVDHYGNSSTKYNVDNLKKILANNKDDLPVIFNALMKNSEFKRKFAIAFMDMTNVNFNYETTAEAEKYYMDTYYPEMSRFFRRFPTWANVGNATDPCIDRMRTFLKKRPGYADDMLKKNLGLGDTVNVNITALNPQGGSVILNTSTLDLSEDFKGVYFNDYDITLTAEPKEGYIFAGWTGSISSSEMSVTVPPSQASSVQALFVAEGEADNLVSVTFRSNEKSVTIRTIKGGSVTPPTDSFAKKGYVASFGTKTDNVTKDMICEVSYTPITYNVKFFANGGTGTAQTQTFTYDKAAKLAANKFTRSGYSFVGWGTKSNSKTADYKNSEEVKNLTDVQNKTVYLYAMWAKSVSDCTVTGYKSSYVYDGKTIRPAVTVKSGSATLKQGTDYTVTYSGGTSCGTSRITIKGIGSYSGTKVVTYKIVPAAPVISKVNRSEKAIRLIWNESKGASYYTIYKLIDGKYVQLARVTGATEYRDAGMKSGTVCKYKITATGGGATSAETICETAVKTKTPTLSVSSASKGKAKLNWNKISAADGYQIVMSTSQNGTYKAIKYPNPAAKTSYTKSQLTSGKTYYFKIRSYKTAGGKKLYSDYSSAVKVKVK